MKRTLIPLLGLLLAGCGASVASQAILPTAQIAVVPSPTFGLVIRRTASAVATRPPPTASPAPSPTASPAPVSTFDQFRLWMEEARTTHPYNESVETMWAVMLCESSGNPEVIGAGMYHGLFQYSPQTWSGEWNPYRHEGIFDPQAQIFATAKAWQDGNQRWWGCYARSS